jgi:hypothetical protein
MEWIRHGWTSEFLDEPRQNSDYYIDVSGVTYTDGKTNQYASEAVKKIIENYPKPYYLCVSGGIDSQSMIIAWKNSGVTFKIISFKYNDTYNHHDLSYLDSFLTKYNLQVDYLNLDLFDFFKNRLKHYSVNYNCDSPQICTHMLFRQSIDDGTLIFSGAPISSALELNYTILGLERFKKTNNYNLVSSFFCYTPELAGSFYNTYQKLHLGYKKIGYEIKCDMYKMCGFDITPQKTKFSGFEKYKDFYDSVKINPILRLKHAKEQSKRNFDILYRYELQSNTTLPNKTVVLYP